MLGVAASSADELEPRPPSLGALDAGVPVFTLPWMVSRHDGLQGGGWGEVGVECPGRKELEQRSGDLGPCSL